MDFFNFNGKLYPEDAPVIGTDNRGLKYGDGLFETLSYRKNKFILLDAHLQRLWDGMKLLQFEIPPFFTKDYVFTQLQTLVNKNKHTSARVRLTILRGDGGLFDPVNLYPNYIIQTYPLNNVPHILNTNGLQLCIFRDAQKICDLYSNIKHNNYLPYLMGAMHAKINKCNDAIILNQHFRVCDSSIANIFLVKNKIIYTPALTEGCVNGIMRQFLIKQLPILKYEVVETEITEDELMEADEIFLTNSIYNIRWVASVHNRNFDNHFTQQLFSLLCKTNVDVFC